MESGEAFPKVDGYKVTARLGEGGSGTVYLAEQQALDRQVALKIITGASATSLPRFHREAAAMAQLSHPGLVRLYDHGVTGAAPFIVMEYMPGGSLHDRIKSGKIRGSAAALRVARELLLVLSVMHDAGLLHRDIKPSNVLLRENGGLVLADLGLVRQDDPSLTRITRDGQMVGTIAYLAPEVYATNELTRATDLFALGALVWEVLTGQPASKLQQFAPDYRAPDPTELAPDCPELLRDVVMEMLDPDPAKRPESAAAALRKLRDSRSRRVPMSPSGRVLVPKQPRPLLAWGIAGAILLALAVGLAVRFGPWLDTDPIVALRAAPTEVSVDLAPHGAELSVSVFGPGGGPAGSRIAPPGGRSSVTIGGLAPGGRYTVSVFRSGSSARVLATREFATAAQVRVIGVEGATAPALWMSANPTMTFTAGTVVAEVGPEPRRIALGAERGPFRLTRSGHPPVMLDVAVPASPEDVDSKLGVCVNVQRDRSIRDPSGKTSTLLEWLNQHDLRYVSLMPGAQGRPVLTPDLLARLSRKGRVAVVARVDTSVARTPGTNGWESELDAPALGAIPRMSLGLRFDWLIESVGTTAGGISRNGMFELQQPWEAYLAAEHKRWHWIRSVQVRDMMSTMSPFGPGFEPGKIEEVNIPIDADLMRPWIEWTHEAVSRYSAGKLDGHVRAVTMDYEREDDTAETDGARAMLAVIRQFVLARRFFPGASVTYDLFPRLMKKDGSLRPVWTGLERFAHFLAGVTAVGELSAQPGSAPSLTTEAHAFTVAFTLGPRRLQVFFADAHPAPATFRPARPGLMRTVVPPACELGPVRFLDGSAPVSFELTSAPTVFEELIAVSAVSGDPARVAVSP